MWTSRSHMLLVADSQAINKQTTGNLATNYNCYTGHNNYLALKYFLDM